ncbi:hypothetical protein Tco_1025211 [Tanacetum coccineum]
MMTGTKSDIEKFDGKNDFALWQVMMKAVLEPQGLTAWSTQQCTKSGVTKHLGVGVMQQQNGGYNMSTYLVNRSPSSAIGFKTPIDMLGIFGWLASIKQGMLEPVKVVLYMNMGFNESGEYKKTFIGSGVGMSSMQVLQGDEFEEVQTQDLIYYHPARDREQHSVRELFSIEKTLKGHSILSLEGSLSVDCDVEKTGKWSCIYAVGSQEYEMVCTRLDIASADVGMLDKFDRGLQTDRFLWILTTPWVDQSQVMNYLLQAIPNDIYNSIDACKNGKEMWERIKRLMFGSKVTSHVRHSRLMDEFDKFAAKEGESLESVYERLTTLVNIMDCNNVRPIPVSINTKFLNFLQPE